MTGPTAQLHGIHFVSTVSTCFHSTPSVAQLEYIHVSPRCVHVSPRYVHVSSRYVHVSSRMRPLFEAKCLNFCLNCLTLLPLHCLNCLTLLPFHRIHFVSTASTISTCSLQCFHCSTRMHPVPLVLAAFLCFHPCVHPASRSAPRRPVTRY